MQSRLVLWIVFILVVPTARGVAAAPLHQQVDMLVESHANFDAQAASDSTDAEFLRRITLDLTGTIPSVDAVRAFLRETSAEKRTRKIDELLASPEHVRQMRYAFDVMLMERKPGKHVTTAEWETYLRQSFSENKPWDQLVTELLTADGADAKTRPAARFLLDRELKVDEVTRDLGRIFLGRDMQCAQCHDHPDVGDYLQRHYHGLAAFTKRSFLFKDPQTGKSSIAEKAEGQVEFTSVFTDVTDSTPPRLLDLPELADPPSGKELYKVKPSKKARAVPVYSRRLQLASAMTDNANDAFRRNLANRLWAMMMGRGLVEPVDMMHSLNPPSHPEVLDLLADSLKSHNYDMRYLLRELALTKTYQRSSRQGVADVTAETYSVARLKPLSPEQLAWSMMQATGVVAQTQAKQKPKKTAPKADSLAKSIALTKTLRKEVDAMVKVFGVTGAQVNQFDAAADQALFLRNGTLIQQWVTLKGGLAEQLEKLDDAEAVEELYLAVFSRLPSESEAAAVTKYLQNQKLRKPTLEGLVWAALVSAEFRFNH